MTSTFGTRIYRPYIFRIAAQEETRNTTLYMLPKSVMSSLWIEEAEVPSLVGKVAIVTGKPSKKKLSISFR